MSNIKVQLQNGKTTIFSTITKINLHAIGIDDNLLLYHKYTQEIEREFKKGITLSLSIRNFKIGDFFIMDTVRYFDGEVDFIIIHCIEQYYTLYDNMVNFTDLLYNKKFADIFNTFNSSLKVTSASLALTPVNSLCMESHQYDFISKYARLHNAYVQTRFGIVDKIKTIPTRITLNESNFTTINYTDISDSVYGKITGSVYNIERKQYYTVSKTINNGSKREYKFISNIETTQSGLESLVEQIAIEQESLKYITKILFHYSEEIISKQIIFPNDIVNITSDNKSEDMFVYKVVYEEQINDAGMICEISLLNKNAFTKKILK